ncbi:MAG: YHS domain-containing protein, partial [Candidatus Omnitrophica bacterium]|nr:YHS domain-containing protein [Candidatus Omnitrophota bacterium]
MVKDPICGMEVDENKAIKLLKDSKTYYFCSETCREKFTRGDFKKGISHECCSHK